MLVRMRHEDVHFEKKKFLTNSGRKKSAPSQRDPPAKIVLAKFLHQNDSKRLYVVSLHCWRWAANAPYGELHTSSNSRSSDHERGEHTTKRLWSGRGQGQSRSNLRRSKALR